MSSWLRISRKMPLTGRGDVTSRTNAPVGSDRRLPATGQVVAGMHAATSPCAVAYASSLPNAELPMCGAASSAAIVANGRCATMLFAAGS